MALIPKRFKLFFALPLLRRASFHFRRMTQGMDGAFFLRVGVHTNLWWIRAIMFGRGLSFAFALIPLQAATFSNISRQDSGRASSLFNTNRQVASSFGVAILATVLADRTSSRVSDVDGSIAVGSTILLSGGSAWRWTGD